MAGSKETGGRDDVQTHLCVRCYAAVNCVISKCKHKEVSVPAPKETFFDEMAEGLKKCGFCRTLSDEQCAKLRQAHRHLAYHFGLRGNVGLRVADALGLSPKEVSFEK